MAPRFHPIHLAAALAVALAGAPVVAAADGLGFETERDRSVTHNEDGTLQIDRSFERTHLESGRTATGGSSTLVTPGDSGASWETTGSRTTLGGTTLTGEGSGSRTRNEDGSLDFDRERTVANPETGASRSKSVTGTRERDGQGGLAAAGTKTYTRTDADGATSTRTIDYARDRDVTRTDDGSRTVDTSWDKTHRESGKTASGASSGMVTRGDDGVSWERSSQRTGFDGRSVERDAAGQRVRDADGAGGTFSRAGTATRRDASGNAVGSRSSAGTGSWEPNARGGRNFRYDGTTTNDRGGRSDVTRQGQTWRGDGERGQRTRSQRNFDDGSQVRRQSETRTRRDDNGAQHQSRQRAQRRRNR